MRVQGHVEIDAPRARVWEVISDPASYPAFMSGVTRWAAETDGDMKVGARYVARWQVGSAPVGATIEIVEFEPHCDLAWTSVTGIDHRGRWRLRDLPGDRTRVTLRLAYQAPGGLFGLVADRVSVPMVRRGIDASLAGLKARVEGTPQRRARTFDPVGAVTDTVRSVQVLARAGVFQPSTPGRLADVAAALRRWGINPAAASVVSAARFPDDTAIIDDRGSLTFGELDRRTNALATELRRRGVGPSTVVGILCRNHRGFVEASVALFKLGADVVYLNTGFSGPQVADVCESEAVAVLVHDEEFAEVVAGIDRPTLTDADLEGIARRGADGAEDAPPVPPARPGRVVILTSGTTGRPKGAPRSQPDNLGPAVALLSRIPLRVRDTTFIAPPLFHAWGFAHLLLGLTLSSTLVLRRRFDPAEALSDIEAHRVRVLVAVPVMLQRLLEVAEASGRRHDTSSLEVVAASGSALSGTLATRFMDAFGDVVYNLYGSTEVAWATIADPGQLRAAPGTAGTPPRGTEVKIVGDDAIELPRGRRGRIFVGNGMTFAGYTGGASKTVLHGLVDTGDVGHFDAAGRLFVEGRSDDMIVSGGENVFPQEVEELLVAHPSIADAAVVGVEDEKFGQRLAAFVVPRDGASVSEDEVRAHVRSHLARYKVPRDVTILEELPRNPTGKVLKRELQS